MAQAFAMEQIATIENDFTEKFGIPRQSGLAEEILSRVVFLPEYRVQEAFRGLEGYSHLWLLWQFSGVTKAQWSPTVRPPRLGGNTRMGVFATRSPYRPNAIGLSSVRLVKLALHTPDGPVLYVAGADLKNGTPILDVKPYLAYTDAHPDASGGFALTSKAPILTVSIPDALLSQIPADKRDGLLAVLAQDPRPQYQHAPERLYTMNFGGMDIQFRVDGDQLYVTGMQPPVSGTP